MICPSDGVDFRSTRISLYHPARRADGSYRVGFELLYLFENYALDPDQCELRRGVAVVSVEPQVFDLLVYLVSNRDRVVSKEDLLASVWGGRIVSESTLGSRINAVRRVIGDNGEQQRLIRTIIGKGVRFVGSVREARRPADISASLLIRDLALPDKPSIAVLPFANLSSDPEQEYFADGMVEEIITALSRYSSLFVIARSSSFTYKGHAADVTQIGRELGVHYIVEGSVRKAGRQMRITAQLIDALSGANLWADRFDGPLKDVFELQDKVAISVAGVIEPALQAAETARSASRPTNDLTTYDLYLRALAPAESGERDRIIEALDLLGRALERDPLYGPALALAAACHNALHVSGWTSDPEANRREGMNLARRALRCAGDDPDTLARAAYMLGYSGEDFDAAIALVDRSVELNPSFARGWYYSGWLRLWAGQPDLAIDHLQTSLRLNARDPRTWHSVYSIGVGHFFARRFESAGALLLRSLQENQSWVPTYRFLASCYAHLGRLDEARELVERLRTITPVLEPSASPWRNPEHRELYLSGLRLAAGETD